MVAGSLRRNLARRMFSPSSADILCKEGNVVIRFLLIMVNTLINKTLAWSYY
jgi:hypothetical protein